MEALRAVKDCWLLHSGYAVTAARVQSLLRSRIAKYCRLGWINVKVAFGSSQICFFDFQHFVVLNLVFKYGQLIKKIFTSSEKMINPKSGVFGLLGWKC